MRTEMLNAATYVMEEMLPSGMNVSGNVKSGLHVRGGALCGVELAAPAAPHRHHHHHHAHAYAHMHTHTHTKHARARALGAVTHS